jgi:hypothetical protein
MKSLNRIQLRRLIPNQFSYEGLNKKNQFKKLVKKKIAIKRMRIKFERKKKNK